MQNGLTRQGKGVRWGPSPSCGTQGSVSQHALPRDTQVSRVPVRGCLLAGGALLPQISGEKHRWHCQVPGLLLPHKRVLQSYHTMCFTDTLNLRHDVETHSGSSTQVTQPLRKVTSRTVSTQLPSSPAPTEMGCWGGRPRRCRISDCGYYWAGKEGRMREQGMTASPVR